jgi:CRISPR type III-A-associated RAMP protein Csm4
MSDCLRIRLRPTGPWRIAPDSGERDRCGDIYHSDALYSAVCGAMLRLGFLEDWLLATARADVPKVRLSSMFPWQGNTYFLPAPKGVWPPPPSSKLYARGARFLPRAVAATLFAGKPIEENRWQVDGVSQCLLAGTGRGPGSGPFRMTIRAGAAVDRMSHAQAEVHRTACIEFASNAGLWFLAEFADGARSEWESRFQAAVRLLADSGFGGRRSIGWGQAEIVDSAWGSLLHLALGPPPKETPPPALHLVRAPEPEIQESTVEEQPEETEPVVQEPEQTETAEAAVVAAPEFAVLRVEREAETVPQEQTPEPIEAVPEPPAEPASLEPASPAEESAVDIEPKPEPPPQIEEPEEPVPVEGTEAVAAQMAPASSEEIPAPAEAPPPMEPAPVLPTAWYLLSLYTPGSLDAVEWSRGAYSLVERTGRVDSPQGSGQTKKSLRMVAEGSLLLTATPPVGAAQDVAPDGFPHPVYRSGFAVAVPVPYRGTV